MKFLFPLVSLLVVTPQIGIAAPLKTAPTASIPRAGEIALDGTVESLDVIQNTLTLRATSFSVGSGATKKLAQPKLKAIGLGEATQWLESSGLKNLSLGDLDKGMEIRVVGREIAGKTFAARLVSWRAPAPQLPLDPLTPRVKAPFLPAPQTQKGITLRVIDAGWMSLAQMWSWESNRRPLFYFAYNLPGASDGQPDSAGWVTSVAARGTKLLRVSGPNGEPVSVSSSGMMEREGGGYGATRAALSGVRPAWKHIVAEFETLDPAAPADASGEFNSVVTFDKVPVPPQNGEKTAVADQEKTTMRGSKIRLQSVRIEKPAGGDKGRTFFDFVITPSAKVADMKVNLDLDKMRDGDENVWNYNSWGSGGSEVHVDAVPGESDRFMAPSIKVRETAPSLKKRDWYRQFRVEVPVASFLQFMTPQSGALPPIRAEAKAFTLEIEAGNARETGTWDGVAWIKNRDAVADTSERWIVREVRGRAAGKTTEGSTAESEYNRQFMRMNGAPAAADEQSNNLAMFFNERPEKFDLELKVEKANRLENFDWLRRVPLPAPGESLDIHDGQFETDSVCLRRVFWIQPGTELPGLSPGARASFAGANLAVVFETLPTYPGANVEIPLFTVQDDKGQKLDVSQWTPRGDVGRAGTENSRQRTIIFAAPPAGKNLDLWFHTVETKWSGQTETVTIKDVPGKG